MRNIVDVIEQIKNVIPDDFESKESLIKELDKIIRDAGYRAPEIHYLNYKDLQDVLMEGLADLLYKEDVAWVTKISDIVIDKERREILLRKFD